MQKNKMIGNSKYKDINSLLNERFTQKKVLVAQHRGAHNGNVPQNTMLAFKTSLLLGADMFELDVSRSKDGKLYCFHDTTEEINLRQHKNIQEFTSSAIAEMELYNSIWEPSAFKVQDMEEVIKSFNHGELYNVDRSWGKFEETFALLKKYPHSIKQALLKAPPKKEILDKYEVESAKFMFMAIVKSVEDIELVKSYKNINTVGFELIADSEESPMFSDKLITSLHKDGYFVWINAIRLSSLGKHILSGGHGDNESLIQGFDKGWGVLIKKHFDIIQTDWPELLSTYRDKLRLGEKQ